MASPYTRRRPAAWHSLWQRLLETDAGEGTQRLEEKHIHSHQSKLKVKNTKERNRRELGVVNSSASVADWNAFDPARLIFLCGSWFQWRYHDAISDSRGCAEYTQQFTHFSVHGRAMKTALMQQLSCIGSSEHHPSKLRWKF